MVECDRRTIFPAANAFIIERCFMIGTVASKRLSQSHSRGCRNGGDIFVSPQMRLIEVGLFLVILYLRFRATPLPRL
jgi:hypothetical protein